MDPTMNPTTDIEPAVVPAPVEEQQVDLAQIKTMLDLPATASDIELITVLVNLVATLQEKYESLLTDAVAMEDNLTNRDLQDFADVIDEHTAPFWREQVLQNRNVALEALQALRNRLTAPEPAPEPEPAPRVIPLRNRLAAIERTVSTVAEERPVELQQEGSAYRIRNRAHEIAKSEKVPFIIAFARAEKEINKEKS